MRANRNAPCPCGSGKKFKRCCRNQAPLIAPVKPRLILGRGILTKRRKPSPCSGPPPAYLKPAS